MKEGAREVFLAPNPGASTLGNKKHRMQFLLLDPADQISVLDGGKAADLVLAVMSTRGTDWKNMRYDPDKFANAIDEQGYRNLQLLRNQGIPSLIGVL